MKHEQPGAISKSTAHVFEGRPHQRHQTETPPMVRLISNLGNDKSAAEDREDKRVFRPIAVRSPCPSPSSLPHRPGGAHRCVAASGIAHPVARTAHVPMHEANADAKPPVQAPAVSTREWANAVVSGRGMGLMM